MIVGIYNISPIVTGGVVPSKSQCNQRFILNTDDFLFTFDGVDENSEVFQEYLDETVLTCLDKYGYIRGTYTFQTTELIQCYPSECGYVLKSDRQKYFEGENLNNSFQPANNNKRSETDFNLQKGMEPMNTEQEEVLDAAMDVAADNEVGDPEDPPLLLPQFWSQEEKAGVKNMLDNEDESLRKLAQHIVETWSGYGICSKGRMTINKTGRDQYGTFTFEACGGFNYSLSRNAPYYFSQLGTMMMFAKNWGVKVWPIKMKFDVADDLWTAVFGIDFNLDDNKAFLRKGAKEIGYIELEEEE